MWFCIGRAFNIWTTDSQTGGAGSPNALGVPTICTFVDSLHSLLWSTILGNSAMMLSFDLLILMMMMLLGSANLLLKMDLHLRLPPKRERAVGIHVLIETVTTTQVADAKVVVVQRIDQSCL